MEDDILKCVDAIHFDVKQLMFHIMDDLDIECYHGDFPSFYDYMEAHDGKWSIEIIETKPEYKDFILFKDLEGNKKHYYESSYASVKRIMRGKIFTYIQNDDDDWLVCLNENEVKINKI